MRRWMAIGSVLLMGLVALGLLVGRRAAPEPTALGVPKPFPTARTSAETAPVIPRSVADLPPQHGPLAGRIESLRAAADAGSSEAACRLALELSHCRGMGLRQLATLGLESLLGQPSWQQRGAAEVERLVVGIAAAREQGDASALHCEGIDPIPENDAVERFQQLALRGSVRQRVVAALMQPDGSLPRLPRGAVTPLPIDPSQSSMASQFYADHALAFLDEGYLARDPLALEALILVHAPDMLHLEAASDLLPRLPDPYRFAGYVLLVERLYADALLDAQVNMLLQRVLESMSASRRDQLEQEVIREERAWRQAHSGLALPPPAGVAAMEDLCNGG